MVVPHGTGKQQNINIYITQNKILKRIYLVVLVALAMNEMSYAIS